MSVGPRRSFRLPSMSGGMRFAVSVNVLLAVVLAGILTFLVNHLAQRHYHRWDWSGTDYYRLSDKTRSLLASIEGELTVLVFFRKNHPLSDEVRAVLSEYQYEAEKIRPHAFRVEWIDPERDLARTRDLLKHYAVETPNVVVFDYGGRRKYVPDRALADFDYRLTEHGPSRERLNFKAEQSFSSAIQSVMLMKRPTVYFLVGHGERNIDDYDRNTGYSGIVKVLQQDNVDVKLLSMAVRQEVPDDCAALVVAGPDRRLSRVETDLISGYLNRSGRVCLMLDPAVTTGLETLLERWGVELARDVVVDPSQTLSGRELFVTAYGDHPITRRMQRVATMFYMPRSITLRSDTTADSTPEADKPQIVVLAASSASGWSENNLDQSPARLDAGVDRPGPVPIAVAIERGTISGIEVQIRPARLVVIGDSSFISNGALATGVGGSEDFFLNVVNWLVDRDVLLAISPKEPHRIRLEMNRNQRRLAGLVLVGSGPLAMILLGLMVWARRRR